MGRWEVYLFIRKIWIFKNKYLIYNFYITYTDWPVYYIKLSTTCSQKYLISQSRWPVKVHKRTAEWKQKKGDLSDLEGVVVGARWAGLNLSGIADLLGFSEFDFFQNLEAFESVEDRRSLNNLLSIMDRTSHLLHSTPQRQQSHFYLRLNQLWCYKEGFRRPFPMFSIKVYYNSSFCSCFSFSLIHSVNIIY